MKSNIEKKTNAEEDKEVNTESALDVEAEDIIFNIEKAIGSPRKKSRPPPNRIIVSPSLPAIAEEDIKVEDTDVDSPKDPDQPLPSSSTNSTGTAAP